jgi:antirestriction protein
MKSFVNYPRDFEKMQFHEMDQSISSALFAHYELYKKVSNLEGTIVKCGIAAEQGFTKFAVFRKLISTHSTEKVIAFEKFTKSLSFKSVDQRTGALEYKIKEPVASVEKAQDKLLKKGVAHIDFIPGNLDDSIPDYLIEHPELKISYLCLDLDDYTASINSLQYFYPRVVYGGITVFDNYHKHGEDYKAITDYFRHNKINISTFSVNKGPHFTIRH